ncbi:DUF883 family protein [Agrobacterium vitis]|uniref:DUF883 family protein n=1 Tax=Agrobacterium vitis TaxID=373 RepID=A0A109CX21_AGRVI|nr:DUF883 family protein [Agrobacterium vitis]KAA3508831.1 DUF883 family protein [Agrobacterium vitis]KAA3521949.1 DUF883 family protein [Agrobacterium vitis]MCE6077845.1 DUF883 family protein [Agrobacterium vitis]MCF1479874.1 DUF883 family protein [Agrobacterium vitis]MCM2453210.1 DUF883 family protein [Agrobacterium vitis]
MVDINEAINDVEAEARSKELEAQIEQLKQDVAALTSTLASVGSATLHQVSDKASDAISSARSSVSALEQDLEDKIRAKPLQSVAIAAGLGFIFALLSRR